MDFLTAVIEGLFKAVLENAGTAIATVLGLLVSTIGVTYTIKMFRLRKEEGAKQPKLDVTLYGVDAETELYFILPFREHVQFMVPLQFEIANFGDKSATDIEVIVLASAMLFPKVERVQPEIATAMGATSAQGTGDTEHKTVLYRRFKSLAPRDSSGKGTAFATVDYAAMNAETIYEPSVDIGFGSSTIRAKTRVIFAYDITVQLTCKDVSPIKRSFKLHCRRGDASSIEEAIERDRILRFEGINSVPNIKKQNIAIVVFEKLVDMIDEVPAELKDKYQLYSAEPSSARVKRAIIAVAA